MFTQQRHTFKASDFVTPESILMKQKLKRSLNFHLVKYTKTRKALCRFSFEISVRFRVLFGRKLLLFKHGKLDEKIEYARAYFNRLREKTSSNKKT